MSLKSSARQIIWIGWKINRQAKSLLCFAWCSTKLRTGNGRRDQSTLTLRGCWLFLNLDNLFDDYGHQKTSAARKDQDMTIEKTMELKYDLQNVGGKADSASGSLIKELTVRMNPTQQKSLGRSFTIQFGKFRKGATLVVRTVKVEISALQCGTIFGGDQKLWMKKVWERLLDYSQRKWLGRKHPSGLYLRSRNFISGSMLVWQAIYGTKRAFVAPLLMSWPGVIPAVQALQNALVSNLDFCFRLLRRITKTNRFRGTMQGLSL